MKTTNDLDKELMNHFNQCNCEDCQSMVDYCTWRNAYTMGYREPRYPVPAHRYNVLFQKYSVEMVIGVTKQWYPSFPEKFRGPYYDCELVAMWTSYPKDLFT